MRSKQIFVREKLIVETFLIGYRNEGESIVFIIYVDDDAFYTGVIDCYEYNSLNKTAEILSENGIEELDFICWTHPDEDHSIGMDILIEKYASEKTEIYLPGYINGEEYSYNKRIKNTFDKINQTVKSRKVKKYRVSDISDYKVLDHKNFNYGGIEGYEFSIFSISPDSQILRSNNFNDTFKKNDYSIGLILNLGEFNFLFASDIENRTINKMKDFYLPEIIDYIKVPHHASSSSDSLLKYLNYENKCELACTTVFKKSKLPDKNIIEKYKDYAREFYSTGKLGTSDTEDYGIINVKCDIINKKMKTFLEGNSEKIFGL